VFVLACRVKNHSWCHGWVDVKNVEYLAMAGGVDPTKVQLGPSFFGLLTNVLQKLDALSVTFLFVINLQLSQIALTPWIAGRMPIAHAVRLRQISSKSF
jgi:hypothetical protein